MAPSLVGADNVSIHGFHRRARSAFPRHITGCSVMQRDRFIQAITSQHRLANEAERLRQQARTLPAGKKRDALLRKARQIDTASHINEWLSSAGLQTPQ
jgi:F420-dependent methylenetetrahydromethanopterin dehydrogenase